MKRFWILFLWIGVSQSIFISPCKASAKEEFAQSDIEKKKIEFLLKQIEQLNGAKFWRNGTFYTPKEAADYLRMKLQWSHRSKPIKTAKDFIENVASTSTMSRKPYQLYLEDGTRVEVKAFLYEKLKNWKDE